MEWGLYWKEKHSVRKKRITLLTENEKGVLESDRYKAEANCARRHGAMVWVGCWARARRPFFGAQKKKPKIVRVALKRIGRLCSWERREDQAGVTQGALRGKERLEERRGNQGG